MKKTRKITEVYSGHKGPVTCVEVYKENYLITSSWDKTLMLWDLSVSIIFFFLETFVIGILF